MQNVVSSPGSQCFNVHDLGYKNQSKQCRLYSRKLSLFHVLYILSKRERVFLLCVPFYYNMLTPWVVNARQSMSLSSVLFWLGTETEWP